MEFINSIINEIDAYFRALENLSKQQRDLLTIVVMVFGALFCFLGQKFFKYLLGLAGFLSGGVVGMTSFYYIPWVNTTGELGQFTLAAVFGAAGALSFYFAFFYFGVFVFGSAASMWLGMIFLPRIGDAGEMRLLLILVLGFVGGLLAFFLRKVIVIIFTAAIGSIAIISGIGYFYNWPLSVTRFSISESMNGTFFENIVGHSDGVVIMTLLVVFTIVGIAVQFYITREKKKRSNNE